ncbi:PAS domain-containing sensor histidine kinase [Sphingomonas sp. BK069]|uniref:sensor histidine kinase n=1 Tax=Sphingomonas sp. BK069 TaxID=2586979 RepID=UPI00161F6570|nr:PAS domain-containing sensor histidine kinase [Sphingomonas sp. BK069]MBB3346484.1 signal transduction histidine kinase [Sphingomonas sp. BK069]
MITIAPATAVIVGTVVALLLVAGAVLLALGLRARAAAAGAIRGRDALESLLAVAPMQPVVVHPDGRVEMARRVADWLGLSGVPSYLQELEAAGWGMDSSDAEAMARELSACQRSARGFSRSLHARDGQRTLTVQGERRGSAVLLWFYDSTVSEGERRRLRAEYAELSDAFDALTGLVEAAPLPMWYRDTDLHIAIVNSAYVSAVEGSDAADVVGRGLELVDGSGQGGPSAGAEVALAEGRPQQRVLPATIGGARRSLRIHDVPLPVGGVAGYAIDIEELEQSHARERRFADAQRAMLDRLSAGVAQFGRDRSLVFCNQPFRRMFAMRLEWLADRPEFDRVLERMREANRVPEVRDFPGWKAERRGWFVDAEGAIEENWHLPGGTHLRVVAQPLPDGGLLLIFEDRTEQVQLASARDTLLRVRTATFDNLFEALGVFAADGRLQLWNNRFRALWDLDEEFLTGHPRVDVIAEKVAAKLSNPRRARSIAELVRVATVERQQRAGHIALADGRNFEFAAVPLPDGNALFTMLDVTDSRAMEQALRDRNDALEAADRVKTAFVANMSYELRTPLTSISGFAEMLHGGYAGELSADATAYLDAILDSVDRLGLLIDDVLDLTSTDTGARPLERSDVDLGAVARAAADALRAAAKRHHVELAIEVQRSAGRLTGDARRIREAIEHLLRHAVGSARSGGRVLLHVDGNAKTARIIVSDDGEGLSPEVAARAFDRFAQSGVSAGSERALGLGLPLAKQFVEAHGGTITLVSEPGEGTLITVELPRR